MSRWMSTCCRLRLTDGWTPRGKKRLDSLSNWWSSSAACFLSPENLSCRSSWKILFDSQMGLCSHGVEGTDGRNCNSSSCKGDEDGRKSSQDGEGDWLSQSVTDSMEYWMWGVIKCLFQVKIYLNETNQVWSRSGLDKREETTWKRNHHLWTSSAAFSGGPQLIVVWFTLLIFSYLFMATWHAMGITMMMVLWMATSWLIVWFPLFSLSYFRVSLQEI